MVDEATKFWRAFEKETGETVEVPEPYKPSMGAGTSVAATGCWLGPCREWNSRQVGRRAGKFLREMTFLGTVRSAAPDAFDVARLSPLKATAVPLFL
jgi:hypothetical protein